MDANSQTESKSVERVDLAGALRTIDARVRLRKLEEIWSYIRKLITAYREFWTPAGDGKAILNTLGELEEAAVELGLIPTHDCDPTVRQHNN